MWKWDWNKNGRVINSKSNSSKNLAKWFGKDIAKIASDNEHLDYFSISIETKSNKFKIEKE